MKKYKITKKQIKQLHRQGNDYTKFDLEYLFPKAFKEEKKELVVGQWYKWIEGDDIYLWHITEIENNSIYCFGFSNGNWIEDGIGYSSKHYKEACRELKEATNQEVEEALIKEAVRRGYHIDKPTHFNYLNGAGYLQNPSKNEFIFKNGILYLWDIKIFENGKWAEIIPTLSPQQAEEKLKELGVNVKIVNQ